MTEALTCGTCQPTSGRDLLPPTDYRTRLPTNEVVALFAGSSVSFRLSVAATFADLADRLDCLGERHIGVPTAIYMKVDVDQRPIPVLHNGI